MIDEKESFKEKLNQLHDIRKEISEIEWKIKKLEQEGYSLDLVEGSSKYFPYTKHSIKVETKNPILLQKIETYKNILEKRLAKLLDIKTEIEQFITTLPTSRLRRIVELRHINQYSWRKVAYIVGGRATEDSVRMEYNRYFEEN